MKRVYPMGYLPKIAYWNGVIETELAKESPSIAVIDNAHCKMEYFIQKEFSRRMNANVEV